MLTELKATCSVKYDFGENFEKLIKPLIEHELLIEEEEIKKLLLTEKGQKYLKDFINNYKYYDVHRSDEILLAMTRDEKVPDELNESHS